MTLRRARTPRALGLAAAALLAVTACGPADGTADGAAPPPATSPAQAGPTGPPAGGPAVEPPALDSEICTEANTDVSVDWALPPAEDDAKLLLTVKNIGDKPCRLYHHPETKFDVEGSMLPPIAGSRPRLPVLVPPGQKAYAGLLARQGDKGAATLEKELIVGPRGKELRGDTGEGVLLELPAPGVHADGTARVTYWRNSSEAAVAALRLR